MVMLFHPTKKIAFTELQQQLRDAVAVTPDLVSAVIDEMSTRRPILRAGRQAGRIARLIEASAWTDVALALVELALPGWSLRRAVYEDGEWLCTFSRHPNLPMELDETVDARHGDLTLAILSALVEARGRSTEPQRLRALSVAPVHRVPDYAVCCDDFA
jgi:hypothetical protein